MSAEIIRKPLKTMTVNEKYLHQYLGHLIQPGVHPPDNLPPPSELISKRCKIHIFTLNKKTIQALKSYILKGVEYAGNFIETPCNIHNVLKPLKGFNRDVCLKIDEKSIVRGTKSCVRHKTFPLSFHVHSYGSYPIKELALAPPSAEDLSYIMNITHGVNRHHYFNLISTLEGIYIISTTPEFQYIAMILREFKDKNTHLCRQDISNKLSLVKKELYEYLMAGGRDIDIVMAIYEKRLYIETAVARLFGLSKRIDIFDIEFVDWKTLETIEYLFFSSIVIL